MKTAGFNKLAAILLIASGFTLPAFGQDAVSEMYYDVLFNEYIELETSILELIESGKIDSLHIEGINNLLLKASEENRTDVISRLKMLYFAVESNIDDSKISADADSFIADMAMTEKKRQAKVSSAGIGKTIADISFGTAVISGVIFAASAMVSQDYYDKYTNTESADQAAFYLFWWEFLENVSKGSAMITIVSSATAGILAAVF